MVTFVEFFQVLKLEKHIVQRNEQFYMNVVCYSENNTKQDATERTLRRRGCGTN